jgi:hypothetical protein
MGESVKSENWKWGHSGLRCLPWQPSSQHCCSNDTLRSPWEDVNYTMSWSWFRALISSFKPHTHTHTHTCTNTHIHTLSSCSKFLLSIWNWKVFLPKSKISSQDKYLPVTNSSPMMCFGLGCFQEESWKHWTARTVTLEPAGARGEGDAQLEMWASACGLKILFRTVLPHSGYRQTILFMPKDGGVDLRTQPRSSLSVAVKSCVSFCEISKRNSIIVGAQRHESLNFTDTCSSLITAWKIKLASVMILW